MNRFLHTRPKTPGKCSRRKAVLLLLSSFVVAASTLCLVGCHGKAPSQQPQDQDIDQSTDSAPKAQKPLLLTSAGGHVLVALSPDWKKTDFGRAGVAIGAIQPQADECLEVFYTARDKYKKSLDSYADIARNALATQMPNSLCTEGRDVSFNGFDGVQYEIEGTVTAAKANFVYVLTILRTKDYYIGVTAWTTSDRYSDNSNDLMEVIPSSVAEVAEAPK